MRSRDTLLRLHRFRTEEKRRQVGDIEAMIADLMRKHDDLDAQIKGEEQRTGVTDPNHFNYSLAAKSTRGRRDNLLKTVGDLKDQLAAAQTALAEEDAELRKVEFLAEKEGEQRPSVRGRQGPQPGLGARSPA
jgi:flagellar FliJ protein